jgi:hypothetical protein
MKLEYKDRLYHIRIPFGKQYNNINNGNIP